MIIHRFFPKVLFANLLLGVSAHNHGQYPLPPNFPPPPGNIPITSRCLEPRTLYDCYTVYLEKYGIHPDGAYLAPFKLLKWKLNALNLLNICRDFDELTQCLGQASTYCISTDVFLVFVQRYRAQKEAMDYLQNHAFFEYACGIGKQIFFDNEECLQRALGTVPLGNRMFQCGQGELSSKDAVVCPKAISVTSCVKDQMSAACGSYAGSGACGAATNVERRLNILDAACLTEMDMRCSCGSFQLLLFTTVYLIYQLLI